jgi:probable O-glycosylation ligase (exosortase A-associated)
MNTISNAGQDSSFMGRVVAWKISTLIAIDNPVTGGGIKALEDFPIWLKYAHQIDRLHMIQTPPPDLSRAHAAHSIYFQALGDQGFVGLFLMTSILLTAYLKTSKLERKAREITCDWLLSLSKMLKISIVVYATAGAALSMVYFDLIFAIYAIVRVLELKTDELLE